MWLSSHPAGGRIRTQPRSSRFSLLPHSKQKERGRIGFFWIWRSGKSPKLASRCCFRPGEKPKLSDSVRKKRVAWLLPDLVLRKVAKALWFCTAGGVSAFLAFSDSGSLEKPEGGRVVPPREAKGSHFTGVWRLFKAKHRKASRPI
ncbi:unnamed protein product [Amoebophrya sp. A120]|nr:unnamed protein product [Amoebophrya sp. A120]|eukprot:GSA120T00013323001.1